MYFNIVVSALGFCQCTVLLNENKIQLGNVIPNNFFLFYLPMLRKRCCCEWLLQGEVREDQRICISEGIKCKQVHFFARESL